jgi:hypothetical protein
MSKKLNHIAAPETPVTYGKKITFLCGLTKKARKGGNHLDTCTQCVDVMVEQVDARFTSDWDGLLALFPEGSVTRTEDGGSDISLDHFIENALVDGVLRERHIIAGPWLPVGENA